MGKEKESLLQVTTECPQEKKEKERQAGVGENAYIIYIRLQQRFDMKMDEKICSS